MIKRSIIFGLLVIVSVNVFPAINNYEHIYYYVSPYSYGIGKAVNSIDNLGIDSFLFNPSLAESKFGIKVASTTLMLNSHSLNVLRDLGNVLGADNNKIIAFAIDQVGKPINFGIGLGLVGLNIPIFDLTLGIGLINLSITPFLEFHNPLSTAGFLDLRATTVFSAYLGSAYSFKSISTGDNEIDKYLRQLTVGVNFKLYLAGGLIKNFGIENFINKDIDISGETILSNLLRPRISSDIGFLYKIVTDGEKGDKGRVNIGLSIKDIGGIVVNQELLTPTTLNIGISYFFDLFDVLLSPISLRKNYVALDFHDIFFVRRDKDFFKRIHIGIHSEVLNISDLIVLKLGLGLNQGYPSFSTSLKLLFAELTFAGYTEELGVYAGQDPDTRYIFSLSLGY
ncbi:MAG: DUF3570 domain-containing protein [Brevinematales bacterium]|nr:DUF3570 domain-containing protein [Brevinematales bacterium]